MVQNSLTARIAGRAVKIGNTPIPAWLLALAIAGTYFGANLVNSDWFVGVCAKDRCEASVAAESVTETGATTNTLWVDQPFGSGAAVRGYRSASGVNTLLVLDLVTNNTNASFDCYWGREDSATGSNVLAVSNLSGTGKTIVHMSGSVVGPDMGFGCNTTSRIKSNTRLEVFGTFVNSTVEN